MLSSGRPEVWAALRFIEPTPTPVREIPMGRTAASASFPRLARVLATWRERARKGQA